MTRPKIVVVGSANTDLVLNVPRLPQGGETILASRFFQALGGKGANQAVAAARLGAEVTFICKLGRDDYGQNCYRAYQAEGLRLDYLYWDAELPSGVAFIFVSAAGENLIGVNSGANARLTPDEITHAAAAIAAADVLLLQLETPIPTVRQAIAIARQHGVRVILNPAPATVFPLDLLDGVDVLTPNQSELNLILQQVENHEPGDPLAWLRDRIPNLVVTLGAQGCRVVAGGKDERWPAFPVQVVDTTAAGDAFNGGLAVALARGLALPDVVAFASAVGALSVTRPGAMSSLPTAAEVTDFLNSFQKRV